MSKPKWRVDTFETKNGGIPNQLLLEDFFDEIAEHSWVPMSTFVFANMIWVVSKRSWWWRFWH